MTKEEKALRQIAEQLVEWRFGNDLSFLVYSRIGEGTGQMPDRVLILRIEKIMAESAGNE